MNRKRLFLSSIFLGAALIAPLAITANAAARVAAHRTSECRARRLPGPAVRVIVAKLPCGPGAVKSGEAADRPVTWRAFAHDSRTTRARLAHAVSAARR